MKGSRLEVSRGIMMPRSFYAGRVMLPDLEHVACSRLEVVTSKIHSYFQNWMF